MYGSKLKLSVLLKRSITILLLLILSPFAVAVAPIQAYSIKISGLNPL